MSTKFFNNSADNTLFNKFAGLAEAMGGNFHTFLAVSGFFRSSGYFKLRAKLENVQKIQILVGINIDDIFRRRNKAHLWFGDPEQAKRRYTDDFIADIRDAGYSAEIENGILQLIEDVKSGRLQMRIHPSKTLHAKFYLCLPEKHSEHSDGWVIMGSSNISDAGLGITSGANYELNVAMKDYDDVAYCKTEFERLWDEGVPFSSEDIAAPVAQTHLGVQPTPFDLYMKVLGETFGARKKVMLLSATAVNNEPDDLRSQILLFQDAARSTFENVPNINSFFAPLAEQYKQTMRDRHDPNKFDRFCAAGTSSATATIGRDYISSPRIMVS